VGVSYAETADVLTARGPLDTGSEGSTPLIGNPGINEDAASASSWDQSRVTDPFVAVLSPMLPGIPCTNGFEFARYFAFSERVRRITLTLTGSDTTIKTRLLVYGICRLH
jgi:hypothetical protein